MENIGVARLMLEKFCTDSNPHLTGRSVHNQRIERLWKDVVCYVVDHYKELFYWMEDDEIVDPNSEVHLLALQIVFLPRINKSLTDFRAHWNNHSLRTEGSLSPTQLWIQGIYANMEGDTVADMTDQASFNPGEYGVDLEAFDDILTNNNVIIPRCPFVLSNEEQDAIRNVDCFLPEDNFGIDTYNNVVTLLQNMTTVQNYLSQ